MGESYPEGLEHLYGGNPDGRRVETGKRIIGEPNNLWSLHHEILNLLARGVKGVEVAKILGCTPQTVSNIRNSELGREKLALVRMARDSKAIDINDEVDMLLPKAMKVYANILESDGNLALKKRVADTLVIDLAGHGAAKKVDITSRHVTSDEISELRDRGLEYARQMGLIVDGEIVEEASDENTGTD